MEYFCDLCDYRIKSKNYFTNHYFKVHKIVILVCEECTFKTVNEKYMKEHGGSVVMISSVGGHTTSEALGVYCMLKDALMHMTRQLAAEMGPMVRVNCIAPGLIRTDFAKVLWSGPRGQAIADALPMKRLGEPSDIGEAALYLSAGADWMTGNIMNIDGGELISVAGELALEE